MPGPSRTRNPGPNRPRPGSHGPGIKINNIGGNVNPSDIAKLVRGIIDDMSKTMNQAFGGEMGGTGIKGMGGMMTRIGDFGGEREYEGTICGGEAERGYWSLSKVVIWVEPRDEMSE